MSARPSPSELCEQVLEKPERIPDVVSRLVTAGARVNRVTPAVRSLEEVYLSLVGDVEGAA